MRTQRAAGGGASPTRGETWTWFFTSRFKTALHVCSAWSYMNMSMQYHTHTHSTHTAPNTCKRGRPYAARRGHTDASALFLYIHIYNYILANIHIHATALQRAWTGPGSDAPMHARHYRTPHDRPQANPRTHLPATPATGQLPAKTTC